MKSDADESHVTWWTMIHGAGEGDRLHRDRFAHRYEPVVRAYLAARWKDTPYVQSIDDAVQEVFVDCLREGGALARIHGQRMSSFRAFLYGVVRNVARRVEDRGKRNRELQAPEAVDPDARQGREATLSRVYDRAWARARVRDAVRRQAEAADRLGAAAQQRVALLHRRFYDGQPIRDIAREWDMDASFLHREYSRARQEFREALMAVVGYHHPGSSREVEQECALLLHLLHD